MEKLQVCVVLSDLS